MTHQSIHNEPVPIPIPIPIPIPKGKATKHAFIDAFLENEQSDPPKWRQPPTTAWPVTPPPWSDRRKCYAWQGNTRLIDWPQLKAFKAGTRDDLDGTMPSVAQGLLVEELDMLVDYLSTLQAP
ncbi:MAG: hypothetical protein ACJAR7_001301 [Polaromonas sp.]